MTDGKVQITIHSTQTELSDEPMEAVYSGNYRRLAGKHIITYDEYFGEEGASPVPNKNLMKIEKDVIVITKRGAITTQMHFEKNKKHSGSYQTPFGSFHMTICTEELSVQETGQSIIAKMLYYLSLNGSRGSKCSILMEIIR